MATIIDDKFGVYSPSFYTPSFYGSETEQKTASVFEQTLLYLKSFNDPIGVAIVASIWGSLLPPLADLSNKALAHLSVIKKPFFIASFLVDLIAAEKLVRGENKELASQPFELAHLAFSLITRGCKVIRWAEKSGVLTVSESLLWQLKFIGHMSTLLRTSNRLLEGAITPSSPLELLNLGIKVSVSAITVYTIFYASAYLSLLQLVLVTGNIALSVTGN